MDLVNGFLNIFAPFFSFGALLLFMPGYLCFKAFNYIWRSVFTENVAGKVVRSFFWNGRGAYLVIDARREIALRDVAEKANWLGSPRAIPIRTDVSKGEECRQLIQEALNQFGRLDHLVLCAGVIPVSMFEELYEVRNFAPAMDTNFWGFAYSTYYAAPHLRKTKGKIIVIASSASWLNEPRLSFYAASKAAVVSFFETLRVDFGSSIGITLVTPGLIESEMTKGKLLNKDGKLIVDQELRDIVVSAVSVERVERLAKATVDSACRGDKYLTVPPWFKTTFFIKMMLREPTDWIQRWFFITPPGVPRTEAISNRLVDLPLVKDLIWPDSIRSPKIKST